MGSSFKVFADTLENGDVIKALCVPGGAKVFSNTDLKKGTVYAEASKAGAKGLPFLKVMDNGKRKICPCYIRQNYKAWQQMICYLFVVPQGSLKELARWCQV